MNTSIIKDKAKYEKVRKQIVDQGNQLMPTTKLIQKKITKPIRDFLAEVGGQHKV